MAGKIAIVVDGGFLKKKLKETINHLPTADEIEGHCHSLLKDKRFAQDVLFRIFYYDCPPLSKKITNPINSSVQDLFSTQTSTQNQKVIDQLKLKEDFAVRLGTLASHGWKLGDAFLNSMTRKRDSNPVCDSVQVTARDLVPNLTQKGVDMKIGLDVALLATKKIVDKVILITGDSDFIPVMKLARREGLKVYLNPMGHPVYATLKEHADGIIEL